MSEEVIEQAALVAPNEAPSVIESSEPSTDAKAEPTSEVRAEAKPDFIPKKFVKADGTHDIEGMAKSYQALEKKLGSKPNIPASSIEDYEYQFSDDFQVDPASTDAFKAEALAKGFTKDQFSFVMEKYQAAITAGTWNADRTEAALKQEWGNDYEANQQAAIRGFQEFAPSDVSSSDPVFNHPVVMKLLARIGQEVGEDSVSAKTPVAGKAMSRDEVETLQHSQAYMDGDKEVHAKVTAWYQKNYK